ncbi:hypothetical protein Y1Q_0014645 [Alligator mississippiensis]|nr:hypothetical protein Y1Q_0014645 [Alligator mississippiensis]
MARIAHSSYASSLKLPETKKSATNNKIASGWATSLETRRPGFSKRAPTRKMRIILCRSLIGASPGRAWTQDSSFHSFSLPLMASTPAFPPATTDHCEGLHILLVKLL